MQLEPQNSIIYDCLNTNILSSVEICVRQKSQTIYTKTCLRTPHLKKNWWRRLECPERTTDLQSKTWNNGIWYDCHTSERLSDIKPGSIHRFLHLKMPVTSQEYDSCCPFVWCVDHLILPFDSGLSSLNFPRSSVFL